MLTLQHALAITMTVVFAILVVTMARHTMFRRSAQRPSRRRGMHLARIPPPALAPGLTAEADGSLELPLYYDENGVFVTDVVVFGQSVSVVVDTGSVFMVVASDRCTTCLDPDDKELPADDGRGRVSAATLARANRVARDHVIRYGSQVDTCDWYVDLVEFPTAHRAGEVCVGVAPLAPRGAVPRGSAPRGLPRKIPFAVVKHRKRPSGTPHMSNYNILGIGRPRPGVPGAGRRMQFLNAFARKRVTFWADPSGGRLVVGGADARHPAPRHTIPMLPSSTFYAVALHDVLIGDDFSVRARHPSELPSAVIVDTGSNMLDAPRQLHTRIVAEMRRRGWAPLSLIFRAAGGALVRVEFDRSVYLWDQDDDDSLLVEATDYPAGHPFGNDVVWGSLFMSGFVLGFDADKGTLGLSMPDGGESTVAAATPRGGEPMAFGGSSNGGR